MFKQLIAIPIMMAVCGNILLHKISDPDYI
jgi:hypothetical protein